MSNDLKNTFKDTHSLPLFSFHRERKDEKDSHWEEIPKKKKRNERLYDSLILEELEKIPNQLHFRIGDVSQLMNLKQYILRYWELEFKNMKPRKAKNQHRCYTRRDVEKLFIIRKLLHRDRVSLRKANKLFPILQKQIYNYQKKKNLLQKWGLLKQKSDDLLLKIDRFRHSLF